MKNDTYSLQASVLGSIMIDPEPVVPLVLPNLDASDFTDPVLRHLYEAVVELYTAQQPIDVVTIAAQAGSAYESKIREIMELTPTTANVEAYVERLRELSRVLKMQELGLQLASAPTLDYALSILGDLNGLAVSFPRRRAASYQDMIRGYLDRQQDKRPPEVLDWGLEQITEVAPLRPGRFVVIGADSSVGKTAFAMQAAYHIARSGKRVAFYSYETSIEDSADRILANAADVNLPRSKRKTLTASDYARVMAEGEAAEKIPLEVVEAAGYTTAQLRTEIVAHHVEVAFIDYVQLIPGDSDNRWETVTRTSMELHTMAQQLRCTIVALSQVTLPQAQKGGARPTIDKHSLRESRQLTNDADLILLLDLADPTFPMGPRVLKVAKNKDGRLGGMYLDFDAEHMRFRPGRPPMQTGEPTPDKPIKPQKTKGNAIDGQGQLVELEDDEPLPFPD